MKIISFNQTPLRITYELSHPLPEKDTLTKELVIEKTSGGWVAHVNLGDSPGCEDPNVAAAKLGEWMYRLSEVIMDNSDKFSKIDLMNVKNS